MMRVTHDLAYDESLTPFQPPHGLLPFPGSWDTRNAPEAVYGPHSRLSASVGMRQPQQIPAYERTTP